MNWVGNAIYHQGSWRRDKKTWLVTNLVRELASSHTEFGIHLLRFQSPAAFSRHPWNLAFVFSSPFYTGLAHWQVSLQLPPAFAVLGNCSPALAKQGPAFTQRCCFISVDTRSLSHVLALGQTSRAFSNQMLSGKKISQFHCTGSFKTFLIHLYQLLTLFPFQRREWPFIYLVGG